MLIDTKKMILVTVLCGLGYMMYSVDRMTISSTISLISNDFGLDKTNSGILLSSFFYGFIAFLFIAGIISDKLSGKPILILGLVTFSLATIMTGVAGSFTSLIFYRVMTGIGEGIFWPAASLEVANVTTEKVRTTVMTLYWMGYPIGSFFGTWLGAHLGPLYGWKVVFYVAGGLGLLISLLYAILVRNDKTSKEDKTKIINSTNSKKKIPVKTLFTTPSVILMALYYFVLLSGWWIVLMWAPSFLMTIKGMDIRLAGTIASLFGVSGVFGGLIIARYCDKVCFNKKKLILISVTIISSICMGSIVLNLPTTMISVLVLLLGFFCFPITPMVLSFTSELTPSSIRGAALGLVSNIGMAAGGISPVLAGYFADSYTLKPVWIAASIVMLLSCILLLKVHKIPNTH